jgi:hypothetical protein
VLSTSNLETTGFENIDESHEELLVGWYTSELLARASSPVLSPRSFTASAAASAAAASLSLSFPLKTLVFLGKPSIQPNASIL